MNLRERLARIIEHLPAGSSITLPVDALRTWLDDEHDIPTAPELVHTEPASWRERLWTVPADMRLGVHEVAEAVGRV